MVEVLGELTLLTCACPVQQSSANTGPSDLPLISSQQEHEVDEEPHHELTLKGGVALRPAWVRTLGAGAVLATFLAWLVPLALLPFVYVLPYLHTMPISERLAVSAVLFVVAGAIARACMTTGQWQAVRARTLRSWKDAAGFLLGLLLAIYAAAALSANTLGLLARSFLARTTVLDLVVTKASDPGRKALELKLASTSDSQRYEITLSKRLFPGLRRFEQGEMVRLEAIEGILGVYVTKISMKN